MPAGLVRGVATDQGFGPDNHVHTSMDYWLIVALELTACDRIPQLDLELNRRIVCSSIAALVDGLPIPPCRLGFTHSPVCSRSTSSAVPAGTTSTMPILSRRRHSTHTEPERFAQRSEQVLSEVATPAPDWSSPKRTAN